MEKKGFYCEYQETIDNIIIMDYRHIDILHSCVILLEPAIK